MKDVTEYQTAIKLMFNTTGNPKQIVGKLMVDYPEVFNTIVTKYFSPSDEKPSFSFVPVNTTPIPVQQSLPLQGYDQKLFKKSHGKLYPIYSQSELDAMKTLRSNGSDVQFIADFINKNFHNNEKVRTPDAIYTKLNKLGLIKAIKVVKVRKVGKKSTGPRLGTKWFRSQEIEFIKDVTNKMEPSVIADYCNRLFHDNNPNVRTGHTIEIKQYGLGLRKRK